MSWHAVAIAFGIAASAVCAVYYTVIAFRAFAMRRTVPTVRDGIAMASGRAAPSPRVCIVVPGHNEERMIAALVRSLAAQTYAGPVHTVLALDRCTDATERIAREAIAASNAADRFEIITIDTCPEGWAGKVHAVHRGVTDSAAARDAEILVFLDADTELDPSCIAALVALLEARHADMLSVMSTLTSDAWWERIAQPAAGIELVRRFPLDRLNRKGGKIPFANGQCMMFRRAAYEDIGGHAAVKDELLEDLALAAKIVHHKRNRSLAVLMADGMVRCRMYESMPEFRRGWKRIFGESYRRDPDRLRAAAWRFLLMGILIPAGAFATLALGVWTLATTEDHGIVALIAGTTGIAAFALALGQMYAAQGIAWWWCITHPLGAWTTASILREAARDLDAGAKTQWGGMAYTRERRS
jgi:glycosyltransferase involved in cell wall biosynthesis